MLNPARVILIYPMCLLDFTDIADNFGNLGAVDALDRGHIAEWPVVTLYTKGGGALEAFVAVVIGFVYFVDQGWAIFGACCIEPMTGRTFCIEIGFTRFCRRAKFGCLDIGLRVSCFQFGCVLGRSGSRKPSNGAGGDKAEY